MKESTRKRMIFGLLAAAIIFGLVMKPWQSSRQRHGGESENQQAHAATAAKAASIAAETGRPAFATAWPRDPFATPDDEGAPAVPEVPRTAALPGEWVLQGIITVAGERACVLNGQAFLPGDMVQGWRVEFVGHNEVHLVRASEKKRLVIQ